MKKIIYTFFSITLFVISCQKFNYQEKSTPSCELCSYADSLEGNFRGKFIGVQFYPNDSMTVNVEHIFLHNNNYDDSTNMYLKVSYIFEPSSNHTLAPDTFRMVDRTGIPKSFGRFSQNINQDDTYQSDNSHTVKTYYFNYNYVDFKQESVGVKWPTVTILGGHFIRQ